MSEISPTEWDQYMGNHLNAHILQTRLWGEFKAQFGWKSIFIKTGTSGAHLLIRKLPFGLSIGYVPKGPIGLFSQGILDELIRQSQKHNAIVLYVEPDSWEDEFGDLSLLNSKFEKQEFSIQPRRSILLSLAGSEEEILGRMKQKTRYNIRLAQKKEIIVESSHNIEIFLHLMKITGERNQFGVHHPDYYRSVFKLFSKEKACELLIAKYHDTPVAALMLFMRGKRAWYFYGASSDEERNRMPAYLLQWEAMRLAIKRGCAQYDLWGVPDFDEEILEKTFMTRDDGLWGVYRFKRGFGGKIARSAGVFQKILNPPIFHLYQTIYKLRKGSLA